MKRPGLKKASKRMSLSKKYRIRKNVANHNKKMRRAAKKNPNQHKKKDPGVPNSLPFKEEILHEAEMRKQRAEEERLRQKEQRRNEVNKRRSLELLQKDALIRQKEFDKKNKVIQRMESDPSLGSVNETSRKAYYKEFRKVLENSDVIVEVLDARDPLGCRCLEMEKLVLESGTNKRIVLLLNKIDLIPKENVEEWLKYLRNEYPTVAFKASTQSQKFNLSRVKVPVKQIDEELLSTTSQCVGSDSLLKLLSNYCRHQNVETSITVGVVGFPNVGKSSVINSLKRTKACNIGATPGVTKAMQVVTLTKNIKILDCPGIVMTTGINDTSVILRNCVKIETLDDPVSPVAAILSRCNKQQIMLKYNVPNYQDANEFLELLARRMGKLKKGGIPNIDSAAKMILQDWNSGRISYYTHPPQEKATTHVSAKIVEKMEQEFDWESLEKDNLEALNAVKGCPSHSASILFESIGPTSVSMESIEEEEEEKILNDDEEEEEERIDAEDNGEGSDMDGEEPHPVELGEITINMDKSRVRSRNTSESSAKSRSKPDSMKCLDDIVTEGRNIQANQKIKQLIKQNKKKRKRADKISNQLGESLIAAMDFSTGQSKSEDYDFETDFVLPS